MVERRTNFVSHFDSTGVRTAPFPDVLLEALSRPVPNPLPKSPLKLEGMGASLSATVTKVLNTFVFGLEKMLETPPPSAFQDVLGSIKTIAETLGLIIGGLWAYYKFFKGRTFRPRLELTVAGKTWHAKHLTHLVASLQIKNVGLSKLELSQEGSALRVFSHALNKPEEAPAVVEWNRQITLSVFEKHRWIEPGETISDQMLIALRDINHSAIKMELRIVSNGIEWNSLTIVDPDAKSEKSQ